MSDSTEQLAIIRKPRIGASDRGSVALSFTTYIDEAAAALQVLWIEEEADWKRALALLRTVRDVHELDGKPCWVDVSRPGRLTYSRPAKIG